MRDYAVFRPRFWIGETGRAMRGNPPLQVLASYLFTSPHSNMIGLYYLPRLNILHETGLTESALDRLLERLAELDFAFYDPENEVVWVVEMGKEQLGSEELSPSDKRIGAIWREAALYTRSPLHIRFVERYSRGFRAAEKGLPGGLKPPYSAPAPAPALDPAPVLPGISKEADRRSQQEQGPEQRARVVLGALSDARGRVVPGARPLRATEGTLKLIAARLREGHTIDDCLHVIGVWETEIGACDDGEQLKKLRGWFDTVTPWRPENFARSLSRTTERGNGTDVEVNAAERAYAPIRDPEARRQAQEAQRAVRERLNAQESES